MTNQPRSPHPDPWALARRIREEWMEAGRDGADRQTQIARVQAARARRAAALSESRIKAAVDKAVREALGRPEFTEALEQLTPGTTPAAAVPPVPERPLHEMTAEEWDAHRRSYWQAAMPDHGRTLTLGDLMGRPAGGDEA